MSSFTQFSGELHTKPAPKASKIFDTKMKYIDPGFEYYLESDHAEIVDIERGYLSDGASIPKFLRWLLRPWGPYGQCAVVHDKLCETWATNKRKLTRAQVDSILFESMKVAGINEYIRIAFIIGVTGHRLVTNPKGPSDASVKTKLSDEYRNRIK